MTSEEIAQAADLIELAAKSSLEAHKPLCCGKRPRLVVRYYPAGWRVYELGEEGEPIWEEARFQVTIYFLDWLADGSCVATGWSAGPDEVGRVMREQAVLAWCDIQTHEALRELNQQFPLQ